MRARTLVCARVRVVGRAIEFHAGGGCLARQLYVQPPLPNRQEAEAAAAVVVAGPDADNETDEKEEEEEEEEEEDEHDSTAD